MYFCQNIQSTVWPLLLDEYNIISTHLFVDCSNDHGMGHTGVFEPDPVSLVHSQKGRCAENLKINSLHLHSFSL